VTGSTDTTVLIWNVSTSRVVQRIDGHTHFVQGLSWDPLGELIASESSDRTCRIFAPAKKKHHAGEVDKITRRTYHCAHAIRELALAEGQDTHTHPPARRKLFMDESTPT
jgi:chromatin assembly factor 1 subunit B